MPPLEDVERVARRKLELLESFRTTKANRARLADAINSTLFLNARLHAARYVDLPGFDVQAWGELAAACGLAVDPIDRNAVALAMIGRRRLDAAMKPIRPPNPNDDRNRFIYQSLKGNESPREIMNELRNHDEWDEVTSKQGIQKAADQFAKDHGLPKIRKRRQRYPS